MHGHILMLTVGERRIVVGLVPSPTTTTSPGAEVKLRAGRVGLSLFYLWNFQSTKHPFLCLAAHIPTSPRQTPTPAQIASLRGGALSSAQDCIVLF